MLQTRVVPHVMLGLLLFDERPSHKGLEHSVTLSLLCLLQAWIRLISFLLVIKHFFFASKNPYVTTGLQIRFKLKLKLKLNV